MLWFLKAYMD